MIEKFSWKKHKEMASHMPFSYFSHPIYLDFSAYTFERNSEHLVVWQDALYPHDFPSMFLPRKKANWYGATIELASKDDIVRMKEEKTPIFVQKKIMDEFFYRTQDLLNLVGNYGTRVRQFEKTYDFRITHHASQEDILKLYRAWKRQRARESAVFEESEAFFMFCLERLKAYKIEQVYVWEGKKLVGLAWGVLHPHGGWVGLHMKMLYAYKGLSRFLHHARAERFAKIKECTFGSSGHEEGIEHYKKELHPDKTVAWHYVATDVKGGG